MCSLVLSSPFHITMHGAEASPLDAFVKYAGSSDPSNGTSTRVVAGSRWSNVACIRSRQRW